MHIKFLSRGKGSAKDAETYLLQKHDYKGEIRADIQVLRGNPSMVSDLADSLTFQHRYTSGVIAWHKDDAPTDEQMKEVLDDFERVSFSGLEANQYSYYAVLHKESDGSKHIHVVSARVELSTGNSMNIAPPNWQKTYDVLVDKYNTKYNWASPKDLHRRKIVNTTLSLHIGTTHANAKIQLNNAVMELVRKGRITTAKEVENYLNSVPDVNVLLKKDGSRRSQKTLSVTVVGIDKNIKLEGLAYAKGFDVRELRRELRAEQEQRANQTTKDRVREYERVSEVLEGIISDRAIFNRGKYIRSPKAGEQQEQSGSQERRPVRQRDNAELPKREPRANEDKSQAMDNFDSHGRVDSPIPSVWNMGNYQIPSKPTPNTARSNTDDRADKADTRQVRDTSMEQRNRRDERAKSVERLKKWALDSTVREDQIKEQYDAIRKRVEDTAEASRRNFYQRATEARESVQQGIRENYRYIQSRDTQDSESRDGNRVADLLAKIKQLSSKAAERVAEFNATKAIIGGVRGITEQVSDLISKSDRITSGIRGLKNGIKNQLKIKPSHSGDNSRGGMSL